MCSISYTAYQCIHLHLQGKFLHLLCRLSGIVRIARSWCKLVLLISDGGSQLRVHPPNAQGWGIYPMRYLTEPGWDQPRGHPLLSHVAYSQHAMPLPRQPAHPPLQGRICAPTIQHTPELSGRTAILPVFQADGGHEKITNVYMGLVVHQVDSCLYSPSQIPNFIQDIESDLRVARNTLQAGGNPSKRHAYCLLVDNPSGIMPIPTDPPYCLVYPTVTSKVLNPTILTLVTVHGDALASLCVPRHIAVQ